MITAIITVKDESIPTVIQQVVGQMSEKHTKLLADEHKKELDKAIDDTRVRPIKQVGNHLKDQIQVENIIENNSPGYGVGNINTLNQKAPWWQWINFGRAASGRTAPPSDLGSFSGMPIPNARSFRTGIWQHLKHQMGGRMYYLAPNKDIQPHNYIEKALGIMVSKVRQLLKI
jgi:hypothetical protein